jgi:hypothetical protein
MRNVGDNGLPGTPSNWISCRPLCCPLSSKIENDPPPTVGTVISNAPYDTSRGRSGGTWVYVAGKSCAIPWYNDGMFHDGMRSRGFTLVKLGRSSRYRASDHSPRSSSHGRPITADTLATPFADERTKPVSAAASEMGWLSMAQRSSDHAEA